MQKIYTQFPKFNWLKAKVVQQKNTKKIASVPPLVCEQNYEMKNCHDVTVVMDALRGNLQRNF